MKLNATLQMNINLMQWKIATISRRDELCFENHLREASVQNKHASSNRWDSNYFLFPDATFKTSYVKIAVSEYGAQFWKFYR